MKMCFDIYRKAFSIAGLLLIIVCNAFIKPGNAIAKDQNPYFPEKHIQRADSLANLEHYNEAIAELNLAFRLLNENGTATQKVVLHNKMGQYHTMSGQERAAIVYFNKALILAKAGNDNTTRGDVWNNLGIAYEYTGQLDSAFYFYSRSLKIREQSTDTARLSESYRNIAQVLRVLRRLDEATKYCRKAYNLAQGIKNFKTVANIYNEMAYLFELKNQADSATFYYNKLIDISKANNYTRGISAGYLNLASVYERKEQFPEALKLKKQGLALDKKIGNIYGIMTSYRTIADTYLLMEQYKIALTYLDSASRICDSIWIADLQGIEESKYQAYRGKGNFEQALFHFEASTILKDSVFNERKRKNIAEILARYETEKKVQEIEILNKTNELNEKKIHIHVLILIGVLLISLAGSVISYLIIHNKNLRLKQMQLELKNYMRLLDEEAKTSNDLPMHETPIQYLMQRFELTQREAEIMQLIGQGFTNTELGEKLFISANTIKYHIKNIYIKLDVSNRVQALKKTSIN